MYVYDFYSLSTATNKSCFELVIHCLDLALHVCGAEKSGARWRVRWTAWQSTAWNPQRQGMMVPLCCLPEDWLSFSDTGAFLVHSTSCIPDWCFPHLTFLLDSHHSTKKPGLPNSYVCDQGIVYIIGALLFQLMHSCHIEWSDHQHIHLLQFSRVLWCIHRN